MTTPRTEKDKPNGSGKSKALVLRKAKPPAAVSELERMARDKDVDVGKFETLVRLRREERELEAKRLFNAAMARVQTKIEPIIGKAKNEQTNSYYAKLAHINKAIRPIYSAEGLSISFASEDESIKTPLKPDWYRTVAFVSHEAGHTRVYHIDLPADSAGIQGKVNKTPVHAAASTGMYGRRLLTCMIFNIATENDPADNDGNTGGALISEEQEAILFDTVVEIAGDDKKVQRDIIGGLLNHLKKYKVEATKLAEIPANVYPEAVHALDVKKRKVAQERAS